MKIKGREIKAIIFDFDGTLLASGDLWHKIDIAFFAKRGRELPETYQFDISQVNLQGAAKITKEKYGIEGTEQEFIDEWLGAAKKAYEEWLPLKEGAKDILEYFASLDLPMALATAGNVELFTPALKRLDILRYFKTLVNVGEVGKSKDFPDIYLEAAKRLGGFAPEEVAVFEDMPTGLGTALRAGFYSVGVYDEPSKLQDEKRRSLSSAFVEDWPSFIKELKEENK